MQRSLVTHLVRLGYLTLFSDSALCNLYDEYLPDEVENHNLLHPAGDDSIDYVASESITSMVLQFPCV
jgi:hypothetical protein